MLAGVLIGALVALLATVGPYLPYLLRRSRPSAKIMTATSKALEAWTKAARGY